MKNGLYRVLAVGCGGATLALLSVLIPVPAKSQTVFRLGLPVAFVVQESHYDPPKEATSYRFASPLDNPTWVSVPRFAIDVGILSGIIGGVIYAFFQLGHKKIES